MTRRSSDQPDQADIDIPTNLDEITPDWLTKTLRATNIIQDASVKSIAPEHLEIQGGTGPVVKLVLDYDAQEEGAPESLIAKLPISDAETRDFLSGHRLYLREVRFFQEIAPTVPVATPTHYYSAINVDGNEYILLMEDLSSFRVGDHAQGCTLEETELAIRNIAPLHARYWGSPKLTELDWIPKIAPRKLPVHQLWSILVQKFGDLIPGYLWVFGEKFRSRFLQKLVKLAAGPLTIVHGDFRPDNFLIEDGPEGVLSLVTVDWQLIQQGRGTIDVAFLIGWCVDTELRREIEMDMLKLYHQSLEELGVTRYSLDKCIHDYRVSLLYLFQSALLGFTQLDFTSDRRRELVKVALQRLSESFEDHKVAELF